jgi:hypothetical protein
MSPPPNEVYTAFSFIGFVLCAIPLYWHLKGNVELKYTRGWSIHSKIARCSFECGHLLIHDLDRSWMSLAMHQLDRMEQEHDQQGSGLL